MLTTRTFTMASAELDYSIEIPDQPCWSQSMEGDWEGDLTAMPRPPCGPPSLGPPPSGVPQGWLELAGRSQPRPPCPAPSRLRVFLFHNRFSRFCFPL